MIEEIMLNGASPSSFHQGTYAGKQNKNVYFYSMTLLQIISYTGIFVFALTGALKARKFDMDIFGGLVVAFATAYAAVR
jgi:hypothetical protein